MPKPISDDQVTYDDGTPQKVENYAKDVSTFLMWTAEPHLEARKRTRLAGDGVPDHLRVLMYFTKKKVWANAH